MSHSPSLSSIPSSDDKSVSSDHDDEEEEEEDISPNKFNLNSNATSSSSNNNNNLSNNTNGSSTKLKRRPWTEEEDRKCMISVLEQLKEAKQRLSTIDISAPFTGEVSASSFIDWFVVEQAMGRSRTAKQCRERWRLRLDPNNSNDPWTPEEDEKLCSLQLKLGNCWLAISHLIPRRSEHACKSRWRGLQRKQRKCPSHDPKRLAILESVKKLDEQIDNIIAAGPQRILEQHPNSKIAASLFSTPSATSMSASSASSGSSSMSSVLVDKDIPSSKQTPPASQISTSKPIKMVEKITSSPKEKKEKTNALFMQQQQQPYMQGAMANQNVPMPQVTNMYAPNGLSITSQNRQPPPPNSYQIPQHPASVQMSQYHPNIVYAFPGMQYPFTTFATPVDHNGRPIQTSISYPAAVAAATVAANMNPNVHYTQSIVFNQLNQRQPESVDIKQINQPYEGFPSDEKKIMMKPGNGIATTSNAMVNSDEIVDEIMKEKNIIHNYQKLDVDKLERMKNGNDSSNFNKRDNSHMHHNTAVEIATDANANNNNSNGNNNINNNSGYDIDWDYVSKKRQKKI